ncbi:MAG: exodeoxyribonuclease V subunit alpha [Burkholderiaceae bacterium]|nr:exodeoxyribonuclease V subunit alpha [Burkholderiaceae bacterium]
MTTPPDFSTMPLSEATLIALRQWSDVGWLRQLDSALAAFMADLDASAPPALLVATALLAHMEGRGHTCLLLAPLVHRPGALLGWPDEAQDALAALWASLPRTLGDWYAALAASSVVYASGHNADEGQPLVLSGAAHAPRLYLRRYWVYECAVAQQILQRTATPIAVDAAAVRPWLDRLFPARPHALPSDFDWQKLACAMALRGHLSVITGGPGTGKTYTAARLLALLFAVDAQPERLRVALAAPTGKAAARLKQSIDAALVELDACVGGALDLPALTQRMGAARTLHALLGARPDTRKFRYHAGQLLDIDVLIVDEASMVHLEMMAALLAALPASARVVFLGDKDQLASVEAGAVLGDLCRDAQAGRYSAATADYALTATGQILPSGYLQTAGTPAPLAQHTVMLRESRRFGGPIGQLALAVNAGDAGRARSLLMADTGGALSRYYPQGHDPAVVLQLALHGRSGAPACYRHYLECLAQGPSSADALGHESWVKNVLAAFERFRLLCAVREGEWGAAGLNRAVQSALRVAGWLNPRGEWYAGRPVMVTRNDPALGVFNGDIGIALPSLPRTAAAADVQDRDAASGIGLRVYFADGPQVRSVGVGRLAHVETAFAMTVHKSQGSEFEHTVLVLPPHAGAILSRELVYTGITRARQAFTLVSAQPGLLSAALQRPTQRASGLHGLLGQGLEGDLNIKNDSK